MKKNYMFLGVIFIVALLAMMPLFTSSYKSSHDTKFHISNIDNLTKQIRKNPINPSKVVGYIGNDFGYGTDIFYPPLGHFSTAYINNIINSPTISLKIVYLISLFLSGLTMFYLSYALSKDKYISLLSSVIYMLFPYHLSDIYIRDALGESLIFIFLPLIFLGLFHLLNNNNKMFYLCFIIGYVGGILSHLTMMVYFTFLIIIFLLFNYKETFKHIKEFIFASIFILLITSPFLVGLLEQRFLGNYRVFETGLMVQGTWGNALNPIKLFPGTGWGSNEVRFYIDIVVLIMFYCSLKKYKNFTKYYKYMLIFLIVSLVLSSILFPWDLLPKFLRIIQFPWRMVTFVSIAVSVIAPYFIYKFKDKFIISFILILFMILLSQPNLKQATGEIIDINNIESWYGMGYQREYLPNSLSNNMKYFDNRNNELLIKEGSANIIKNDVPYLEFNVNDKSVIELPRIYYIGYTLKDENNKEYEIYENENGFIETKLDKGKYILDFTGTKYDNIAKYISLFSILLFGVILWLKK